MSTRPRYAAALTVPVALLTMLFSLTTVFADSKSSTPILGRRETVLVGKGGSSETVRVLAKLDTGAAYSSIDTGIAKELGIDLASAPRIRVESALGRESRPLVEVKIQVAGRTLHTLATVNSRKNREEKMLLGRRDLQGFLLDVSREQLTTPTAPSVTSPVQALLEFPPPPPSTPTLLATIPLAGLLIVILRTVIGLETFGLFAPVLLAIAFVQIGLPVGVGLFLAMLLIGLAAQWLLRPLRLPQVARLAILLAVGAEILLALNALVDSPQVKATWASAVPLVVISGIIERFWGMQEQTGLREALAATAKTVAVAVLASPVLIAAPVRDLAADKPFLFGLVAIVLVILVGRYRGLRLTELVRFQPAIRIRT